MKKFNKVLAIVLTIFTLVASLPVSAFADAWLDVDASTNGSSSTVQVTLDAGTLADILEKDGISADLLKDIMSGVSVDVEALKEVFTVSELLEIVPRESLVEIFDIEEIVSEIGLDTLAQYVEIPELLDDVDTDTLADLINDIPDLENYVDAKALLRDKYVESDLIIKHMYEDRLLNDLDMTLLKKAVLEDANLTIAEIKSLVYADDMVTDRVIDVDDVLDKPATEANIALLEDFTVYVTDMEELKAKIKAKYPDLKKLAELDNLEAVIDAIDEWDPYVEDDGTFDYEKLYNDGHVSIEELLNWEVMNMENLYHDGVLVVVVGTIPPSVVDIPAYIQANVNDVVDFPATEQNIKNMGVAVEDYLPATEPLKEKVIAKYEDLALLDSIPNRAEIIDIAEDWKDYVNDDGSIKYVELMHDEKITANELLDWEVLDTDALLEDDVVVVDQQKLIDSLDGVAATTIKEYLVSMTAALEMLIDKLGLDYCANMIGGYDKVTTYINIPALVAEIDVPTLIDEINANPDANTLETYVDVEGILDTLSMNELLDIVPMDVVMAQISNDEMMELLSMINLKQYIQPVLTTVFDKVMSNVDKLEINGYVVAEEKADKLLAFNAANLVRALASTMPTLSEFANMTDGKLVTLNVSMVYTVDYTVSGVLGKQKTKDITFEFVVDGDLSRLQNAAGKLDSLLKKYINEFDITGGVVTLDVTVPGIFTKLYARVLDAEKLPEALKTKLVALPTLSGDEAVAFVENLTFEEIIALMDSVEPSKLYNAILNVSYVQVAVEKVNNRFGYNLANVTLDDMLDIAANVPSVERICEIIENKTGRDVMAYIETAANKADAIVNRVEKISAVEKILDKVSAKLNVDLSAISAADLVDRAKDAPLSETISNAVASKIGVNVKEVLETYTADELYQLAINKAANGQDIYNKVTNAVRTIADILPDELMRVTLSDAYKGDGVFGGDKTVTFNAKALIEKLLKRVGVDLSAADFLLNRLGGGSITVGADLTARFQNLYEITYMSRDGKTELFKAYLPVGADLDVFKNNPGVTGYKFVGWTDEEGNLVETMPAADTTVYADRHLVQVTFRDNGKVIGTIVMEQGDTLGDYAELFAAVNAAFNLSDEQGDSVLFENYTVGWYNSENGKRVFADTRIENDIIVDGKSVPDYFLRFNIGVDYYVTENNGAYIIHIIDDIPAGFVLDMDYAHILKRAKIDTLTNVTLTVRSEKDSYDFLKFEDATLAQFYGNARGVVEFSYDIATETPDSFANTPYAELDDADFYVFDLLVDGKAFAENFASPIEIRVPYANANLNSIEQAVRVRTIKDGVREKMNSKTEPAEEGVGYVWFEATHFSDFVVSTESRLALVITDVNTGEAVSGTLKNSANADLYFPVGEKITLDFVIPGYCVVENKFTTQIPGVDGETERTVGAVVEMTEAGLIVNVPVELTEFYIYYYVNGELREDLTQDYLITAIKAFLEDGTKTPEDYLRNYADAIATATAPANGSGYKWADGWVGFSESEIGVANMYLVATWTPIEYTVEFKGVDGNVEKTFTGVTVENYETVVIEPAIPVQEGKLGEWEDYDLSKLPELAVNGVYTINAKYNTKLNYAVSVGDNVSVDVTDGKAACGDTVTVTVDTTKYNPAYYDAEILVYTANGSVKVVDGKFEMPAENVYVYVEFSPKAFTYTINGEEKSGNYGEMVSHTIQLNVGQVLTSVPADWMLASFSSDASALRTLVYEFKVTGDAEYTVEVDNVAVALFKIINGKLFGGEGNPEAGQKNVSFKEWSDTVAHSLQFAVFSITKTQSLLWLWILLAVVLLILIIVILYRLYITGKIRRPLFLMRFVTWLVGLFFAYCLAVSALCLKIAGLFGKSKKPEDYGFAEEKHPEEPFEKPVEEESEETSEEASEEATGDAISDAVVAAAVAEAVAEDAAEEAAEEVAEEATEEVAEEATDQNTEE